MQNLFIEANHHIRLRFHVPFTGVISFELRSSVPVKTYVLDPPGLAQFGIAPTFYYYGGFPEAREFQSQRLILPFRGDWYLVILNPNLFGPPASVTYEVKL
jgi:hypothetical protein